MTLAVVGLPSFDNFLRSARSHPAVLPRATTLLLRSTSCPEAPMMTTPTTTTRRPAVPRRHYGPSSCSYYSVTSLEFDSDEPTSPMSMGANSPPGSPDTSDCYYGQFTPLSPTGSAASWPLSEDDVAAYDHHYDHEPQYPRPPTPTLNLAACSSGYDPAARMHQYQYPTHCAAPLQVELPRPHHHRRHGPALRIKKKYLKERQRCEIVRRVQAGEKQAHLAREFGVSRAAVCYLLKHQGEILQRSATRRARRAA